jgi:hypothetical protein
VLGLAEVTADFHYGLAESAKRNPLVQSGCATHLTLDPNQPLTVNYIMAVAPIPKGFDRVAAIIPAADGQSVRLVSGNGRKIRVSVDLNFLGIENKREPVL